MAASERESARGPVAVRPDDFRVVLRDELVQLGAGLLAYKVLRAPLGRLVREVQRVEPLEQRVVYAEVEAGAAHGGREVAQKVVRRPDVVRVPVE